MVTRQTRAKARELRASGLTGQEIADLLQVSLTSIIKWTRDPNHPYSVKARVRRLQWQEEGRKAAREANKLHRMGSLLYWAEGGKSRNSVVFGNTDTAMMLLFIKFLRTELAVKDDEIKLHIQAHAVDPIQIKQIEYYWLNILILPHSALMKTHLKKGNHERKHKTYENGFCVIYVNDTRLVQHIYGAIQEYGGFDNPEWLF